MLNKYLLASVLFLSPLPALAQGVAPTRVATETTPEQEAIIRAGIDLHDKGQFDQAIAKYQEVLGKSPSNVTALFEMAYSYLSKKDFDKSLETARKGAEFKSDLLPMFYDVMASSLDGKGQPQQAIEIYKKGIALVPDASQLYYNMAVTYRESLGSPDDARLALQKAATIEPMHPGVQLLLGQVYQSTGYTTPAFLALSTFLVLDAGGNQALPGYGLWRALLKGGVDPIPDSAPSGAAMRGAAPKRAAEDGPGRLLGSRGAAGADAHGLHAEARCGHTGDSGADCPGRSTARRAAGAACRAGGQLVRQHALRAVLRCAQTEEFRRAVRLLGQPARPGAWRHGLAPRKRAAAPRVPRVGRRVLLAEIVIV